MSAAGIVTHVEVRRCAGAVGAPPPPSLGCGEAAGSATSRWTGGAGTTGCPAFGARAEEPAGVCQAVGDRAGVVGEVEAVFGGGTEVLAYSGTLDFSQ